MSHTSPSEPTAREVQNQAQKTKDRHVYLTTNSYTTTDEKVEIEAWYQLPIDLAGFAFDMGCLFWARGNIGGWHAYAISFAVGILTAVTLWFVYVKRIVFGLSMLTNFPVIRWLIHFGFAAWLVLTGSWVQGVLVALNCLLLLIPVGWGAILANQILTLRYKMHPKYAFLKHVYGKEYSFESD